jgi:hypothetical protein
VTVDHRPIREQRSRRQEMDTFIVIGAVLGWLVAVLFFVALCIAAKAGQRGGEEGERPGEAQAPLRTRPVP